MGKLCSGVFLSKRRSYVDFHYIHRTEEYDGCKKRKCILMEIGILKVMVVKLFIGIQALAIRNEEVPKETIHDLLTVINTDKNTKLKANTCLKMRD